MRRPKPKPQTSTVVHAVVYTRVSSDEQANEGTSLDAQLSECRRHARRAEFVIDREFQDVMSGKRDDRPQYQRLLAHVHTLRAEGKATVVVVAALDRFGRRMLERVRSREELKALGVPTHSVREGGEVSDLVANILASVAQEEVARLGMRISKAWEHLQEQGWMKISGNGVAWGYRSREATRDERNSGSPRTVIEPDPVQAPYVTEAFARVARGEQLRSVGRWCASLPPEARGNRAMTRRTIQGVLRNDTYAALSPEGKPARWEALVDDMTWQRVRARFEQHQRTPLQASNRYLLTGFVRCPACGARMNGEIVPTGRRYRCSSTDRAAASDPVCNQTAHQGLVDALVLNEVSALIDRIAATECDVQVGLKSAWAKLVQPDPPSDHKREIRGFEQVATIARSRITKATELFVDGSIDREAYDALIVKARAELVAAESDLAQIRREQTLAQILPPLDAVLTIVGGWTAALHAANTVEQRDVLRALVERVIPHRIKVGAYEVQITWTTLGDSLHSAALDLAAA